MTPDNGTKHDDNYVYGRHGIAGKFTICLLTIEKKRFFRHGQWRRDHNAAVFECRIVSRNQKRPSLDNIDTIRRYCYEETECEMLKVFPIMVRSGSPVMSLMILTCMRRVEALNLTV